MESISSFTAKTSFYLCQGVQRARAELINILIGGECLVKIWSRLRVLEQASLVFFGDSSSPDKDPVILCSKMQTGNSCNEMSFTEANLRLNSFLVCQSCGML
ncbi:hypothetical protein PHYBLDRAFT_73141 [Phycomyces blakesleeanus NRRL 1555(-)]|uniref:Uncharacterized protein n=1 Tax=Phycomyces blakesleeanus (strain ATCC 8743b / DSM 1359 / FGSC 10004 / NBRC 33097 / NRRL 1555) TaxID=763407 RepID=A0A162ZDY4_PHYB8|nr:hypothetical protein PHYBLDRAFT_73141 [Phycomyces blakesleeanus NRRL 1555(-)]OAD66131.1 hypothetical protein PHYBLDRAFT_73141 [Phycomyces blakesleeanus NRRL 1555(-)]|eukprot:XP_018284171.1 hypothetical protein PHYBLDRAFT_73141 [Phycomyces blakesleeanus NRRL 1555(-)]